MRWHRLKIAATICFLSALAPAQACQCIYRDPAGFVHRELARLPAYARGVLFMPQQTVRAIAYYGKQAVIYASEPEAPQAAWFRITSDRDGAALPVQLSWPDLSRGRPDQAAPGAYRFLRADEQAAFEAIPEGKRPSLQALLAAGQLADIGASLQAAQRLLRVGPAGGFQPGARYTISYLREIRYGDNRPLEVAIDSQPLDSAALRHTLVPDGAPERRLLPLIDGGGSCSVNQPALAQAVHYELPPALQPYRAGVAYFSESRPAASNGEYADLAYSPSLCHDRPFGASTLGDGREQLYARCGGKTALSVRGWAGLLEVEDRLRPTDAIEIELGTAPGSACSGMGILRQALEDGDRARISDAACSLELESRPTSPVRGGKFPATDLPPASSLLRFGQSGNVAERGCAFMALSMLAAALPAEQGRVVASEMSELLALDLKPADKASADRYVRQLRSPLWRLGPALRAAALRPALPALVEVLEAGQLSEPYSAAGMIATAKDQASPYTERLLAVAQRSPADSKILMPTLAAINPADGKVQALLLRSASQPELLETAAVAYAEVAGPAQRAQAVRLLSQAVAQGGYRAIDSLAGLGPDARSAIPLLVTQLEQAGEPYVRNQAYRALAAISSGEPEAVAAIGAAINTEPGYNYPLKDLAGMGVRARPLLPAIEQRMQRPMTRWDRDNLKATVRGMQLPAGQQQVLLDKLDACTII